jgi:oligoendopeptidase F
MHAVYAEHTGVFSQIYRNVAADWYQENVRLRGYASPISVRNLVNELPDPVVNTLLESCRENAELYRRYFRLKARWLGLPALRRVDLYAPLTDIERTYTLTEGLTLTLDSMRAFSPEMAEMAERVVAERHLDAEPRRGKDGGAFCYGVVPDITPWVSINYNGRIDDVATLAHELGHAVHSQMASEQSVLTFHAPLPMAETASNFAEMLLLDRLLDQETDPQAQRALMARFVDGSYVSILRQAYFVVFEREAHLLVNEEEATSERLAEVYMENLREQFGDSVVELESFRWEWTSIPHLFEVPFYCYAYSFGLLLVLALYQAYRREGADFVPRYLKILAYGGSKAPLEILDEAGFDLRSKAFWQGGFDVIAGMIDELERLPG